MRNVDGTPLNHQSNMLDVNVGKPAAYDQDSSLYQLSKLSAKYEHTWMKKLSNTKPEPPMLWPYRSFNPTPDSESVSVENLI